MIAARLCGITPSSASRLSSNAISMCSWPRLPQKGQLGRAGPSPRRWPTTRSRTPITSSRLPPSWKPSSSPSSAWIGSAKVASRPSPLPPLTRNAIPTKRGALPEARTCAGGPPPFFAPSGTGARPKPRPSTAPTFPHSSQRTTHRGGRTARSRPGRRFPATPWRSPPALLRSRGNRQGSSRRRVAQNHSQTASPPDPRGRRTIPDTQEQA